MKNKIQKQNERLAKMWADELENDNWHSFVDMPLQILKILNEEIVDENIVNKLMKKIVKIEVV